MRDAKRAKDRQLLAWNLDSARRQWINLTPFQFEQLKVLTDKYSFSVFSGDLILIDNRWYVTHTGLLRLAARERCCGINVRPVIEFCDAANCRWAFEATVYKSRTCKGFTGFGDADISNTSALVQVRDL